MASTVSAMLSYDYVLENNQGVFNLFSELSSIIIQKYDDLTSFEREIILNKSYDICKALIYWDVDTVFNTFYSENAKFDNANFLTCLNLAKGYINLIKLSISNELDAMLDGLNGRYIPVGEGGEVVSKTCCSSNR